jgi:hypothetical protein
VCSFHRYSTKRLWRNVVLNGAPFGFDHFRFYSHVEGIAESYLISHTDRPAGLTIEKTNGIGLGVSLQSTCTRKSRSTFEGIAEGGRTLMHSLHSPGF